MPTKPLPYIDFFGDTVVVFPVIDVYRSTNNLYIGLKAYDEDLEDIDHYCDVTVNITDLPYLQSTIDTNNNGDKMIKFLEENGFGHATGRMVPSGYCWFPVFEFDPEMLKSLDIDTFAFYSKFHNVKVESKPSLDSQIRDAKEQAPEKGPTNRDPHELQ